MALADELARTVENVRAAVPAEIFAAIGQSIADLRETGQAERAVGVGAKVEVPVLADLDGATLDLASRLAGKPYVLMFYRGGWCPYCNVTLQAYAKVRPEIADLGAELLAVTPELPDRAAATADRNGAPFTIAVDQGNRFARQLGLVFDLPEGLRPLYRQIGIDLPDWNGDDSHELPMPATLVVDGQGIVRWAHVEADFTSRADPAAAVDALRALGRD